MLVLEVGAILLAARSASYAIGMVEHARRPPRSSLTTPRGRERATVLIPAYNEEAVLEASVTAALATGCFEILIVDDGSTDATSKIGGRLAQGNAAVRYLRLDRNRGKAHALNAGLEAARFERIVCVDADTTLHSDALYHLLGALQEEGVVAVAGAIHVANEGGILGQAQVAEYALECERRRLQELLGTLTTVPGSLGAFRRSALREVGGYPTNTLTEDTAATLELLAQGGRVIYAPAAEAWTEVPGSIRSWWVQRDRWSTGFFTALLREEHWGRFLRLLFDEFVVPLLAPWLCLALILSLPARSVALCLVALCLSSMVELAVALHLQGKRITPLGGLAVLGSRACYVWLTTFHLLALLARLSLRRKVRWEASQRSGQALSDKGLIRARGLRLRDSSRLRPPKRGGET